MIETIILDRSSVNEAMELYRSHAPYGLRFPKDPSQVRQNLGTRFFLFGVRINARLVAVAWAAEKGDLVYFGVENECLVLKNDGVHVDCGGWLIHSDFQGRGLLELLNAVIFHAWFVEIHPHDAPPLWGRMVGEKDQRGDPLFWARVGTKLTGLSYSSLLDLPFGDMEKEIYAQWPKKPLPLADMPVEVLSALGKTADTHIKPRDKLISNGYLEVRDRYVPTSLNYYIRATSKSVREPKGFLKETLENALTRWKRI